VDEDRLIEIESKLAHQEHLLEELNDALGNQQSQITHLEALCRSLIERLRSLGDAGDGEVPGDERPPHY
jgi:SlyX protein